MPHVLLAHAADAETRAERVAAKLRALGFEVRAPGSARPHQDVAAAAAVLVLWSRNAKGDERALTRAAQRAGKLTIARLDPVTPPVAGGVDLATWNGRETRAWSKLVSELQQKAGPAPKKAAAKKVKSAKPQKSVTVSSAPARAPAKAGANFAMLSLGFVLVFATLLGAAALFTPALH